jgi:hypothetical protein
MLAPHLLRSALVPVTTRMADRVLGGPGRQARPTDPDKRGMTPLFWSNVALHGEFELDLDKHPDFDHTPA